MFSNSAYMYITVKSGVISVIIISLLFYSDSERGDYRMRLQLLITLLCTEVHTFTTNHRNHTFLVPTGIAPTVIMEPSLVNSDLFRNLTHVIQKSPALQSANMHLHDSIDELNFVLETLPTNRVRRSFLGLATSSDMLDEDRRVTALQRKQQLMQIHSQKIQSQVLNWFQTFRAEEKENQEKLQKFLEQNTIQAIADTISILMTTANQDLRNLLSAIQSADFAFLRFGLYGPITQIRKTRAKSVHLQGITYKFQIVQGVLHSSDNSCVAEIGNLYMPSDCPINSMLPIKIHFFSPQVKSLEAALKLQPSFFPPPKANCTYSSGVPTTCTRDGVIYGNGLTVRNSVKKVYIHSIENDVIEHVKSFDFNFTDMSVPPPPPLSQLDTNQFLSVSSEFWVENWILLVQIACLMVWSLCLSLLLAFSMTKIKKMEESMKRMNS